VYIDVEKEDDRLVEMHTKNWLRLGVMLKTHRMRVEQELGKGSWTRWALENLKMIKPTRLRQVLSLPEVKNYVNQYSFMGIDRVHRFKKVVVKFLGTDEKKNEFKEIAHRFGWVKVHQLSTDAEKAESCKAVDKICDYVYASESLASVEYDRDLLMNAIETRCKFGKQALKEFKAMESKQERDDYLKQMIVNGSGSVSDVKRDVKLLSFQTLIARLVESVEAMRNGTIVADKLDKSFVQQGLDSLMYLIEMN
jgi:hypothetical protein